MPNAVAPNLSPVADRFIGAAPELSTAPGTAVLPTTTINMTTFGPKDAITPLVDTAWRNSMGEEYGLIQGTYLGDLSMGGSFFGDTFPMLLANILGDYSVAMTNPGTPVTLGASAAAGTNQLTLTSGVLTLATPVLIYNTGATGFAEVVTPTAGTGTGPYTLNRKLYYTHASGATVSPSTGTSLYTHTFTQLNNGTGAGGWCLTQPRTHTFTDYTGVTAAVGARCYAYTCLSDLNITATSTALLVWDAKANAFLSTAAVSAPTASPSGVAVQPSWNAPTFTVGGTQTNNIAEYKLGLQRTITPKWTNQGSQQPYALPRGPLKATMSMNFDPAIDESAYLAYLNNTQPTIVITQSNGAAGQAAVSVTITAQTAAYDASTIEDSKTTFGYATTQRLIQSTSNIGPSGGYTPVSIAVKNAVPSY
jgi:hypothetical protein